MKKMETLENLSVVYVENDQTLQANVGKHLKSVCSKTFLFNSTLEALKNSKKLKPDILITNIKQQRVSGLDLFKALKQLNPNLECIITSSTAEKKVLLDSIRLDVVDFIEKPFEFDSLNHALIKASSRIKQKHEYIDLKRESLEHQMSDDNHENIYKIFDMLRRDEIPIDIINFYKGVPIINSGYVKEVRNDSIFIQTSSLQKLVMNLETFINVESSVLPRPIKFDVSDIKSFSEPIQIVNPKIRTFSLRRRKDIRLLPCDTFTLTLENEGQLIKVKTEDVSTQLITYNVINIEDKDLLDDGKTIDTQLNFTLDKVGSVDLNFKSVVSIIKRGEGTVIYAIKPILEGQDREDLDQYILQREFQIITELKNLRLVNGI